MRIAIALIGFLSATIAPWWVPLTCILLLSLRWRAPEALLIGLTMDFLWLPAGNPLHTIPVFTIAAIAIVWLLEPLRVQLMVR